MKILICTQIMDRKDSTLGFFQKWVSSMAPYFESVEVVCLKEGEHGSPSNVKVHSLGKEFTKKDSNFLSKAFQRFKYIFYFYRLLWKIRGRYDAVFVHMNQEYILLGGVFWKLFGKKMFMWRNHYDGSVLTDIAGAFCEKVFCTSRFSYTARYKKTVIMPVGVDEDSVHLDEDISRIPRSILFLGRLDVSKRPDVLIDALGILSKKGIQFTATFVGGPSKTESEYPQELKAQTEKLGISDRVRFVGAVPNTETYRYYRSADVFVNCSKSGMFDKTIFKAAASGCLVLATSRDFGDLAGEEFIFSDNDSNGLAKKLERFLNADSEDRLRLTGKLITCIKNHRLPVLIERLAVEIKK